MTPFRCDACGRDLAGDTLFCPYCGADRRPAPSAPPEPPSVELAAAPVAAPADAMGAATAEWTQALAPSPAPPAPPAQAEPRPARPATPPPRRKARGGCATPLLAMLILVLVGVSWCALHRRPTGGAPAVAGATAAQPMRVARRWRTVRLPGDAPATARFAVSSDTPLRIRAGGRIYAVRPRHALQLPDDVGEDFDVRTADYVSSHDAARAKAALVTLAGR